MTRSSPVAEKTTARDFDRLDIAPWSRDRVMDHTPPGPGGSPRDAHHVQAARGARGGCGGGATGAEHMLDHTGIAESREQV